MSSTQQQSICELNCLLINGSSSITMGARTENNITEYDVWLYENEEAILIELAENGADRELDFDLEAEFDKRYQQYLDSK